MPAPTPLPTYIYKLLPSASPSPLPDKLPPSPLDAQDGFIHLSTAEQTPATAARFFTHAISIWLLKIPLQRIEQNVKWEATGSDGFPHLYGKSIGKGEIEDVRLYRRKEGEDWLAVLEGDEWLVGGFVE